MLADRERRRRAAAASGSGATTKRSGSAGGSTATKCSIGQETQLSSIGLASSGPAGRSSTAAGTCTRAACGHRSAGRPLTAGQRPPPIVGGARRRMGPCTCATGRRPTRRPARWAGLAGVVAGLAGLGIAGLTGWLTGPGGSPGHRGRRADHRAAAGAAGQLRQGDARLRRQADPAGHDRARRAAALRTGRPAGVPPPVRRGRRLRRGRRARPDRRQRPAGHHPAGLSADGARPAARLPDPAHPARPAAARGGRRRAADSAGPTPLPDLDRS